MITGSKATEEHKNHISEGLKKSYLNRFSPMKGRHHSEESKRKLSIASTKALTGKIQTEEHKRNNSIAHKGIRNSPSTEFKKGVRHTDEWKQLMSAKFSGINSPRWKGGYQNKLWHNNQRRVNRLGNGGCHTLSEWEALKVVHKFTCLACLKREPEIRLSRDHIVPLIKGGSDDIDNIQPLCRSCNSIKHSKIIKYA